MTNYDFILMISQKYYKSLYQYVKQICRDKTIVADIVQDTFMIAYEKADALRDHQNIQGWLYRTARYRTLQVLKSALEYEELSTIAETVCDDSSFEDDSIAIIDLYPEMAKHLKPQELQLIIRHYEEGYNYSDLAEEYHTSQISVKSKLQRIRKKLQQNIKLRFFIF